MSNQLDIAFDTPAPIDLYVENLGTSPSPLLVATDWFDEGRRAARFLVPPLSEGATARAAYRVPTRRRGREGRGGDLAGLSRSERVDHLGQGLEAVAAHERIAVRQRGDHAVDHGGLQARSAGRVSADALGP